MMKQFSILLIFCLTACTSKNDRPIAMNISLSDKEQVLNFDPPLKTPSGCSGQLLVALPDDVLFGTKTSNVLANDGKILMVEANMISGNDSTYNFKAVGHLIGERTRYIILLPQKVFPDSSVQFRRATISSSSSFVTKEVIWSPDCK